MAGPRKIVFVGGAPRSGTSVTHALICTSASVCEYHREISFFRGIPLAYRNGRAAWREHTSTFFETPEAFRDLMRRTADLSLDHVWTVLGRPPILAVKDPHLTPLFPQLRDLYPDIGAFVTVVRHPFEVVRSRQEVHEQEDAQRAFGAAEAEAVAREYLAYYRTVLNTNFGGRHFAFRYEDLNDKPLQQKLAHFVGVDDLHTRPMWGRTAFDRSASAWNSPKYDQPIDLDPRLSPLAPELRETVRGICSPIMERFGYS